MRTRLTVTAGLVACALAAGAPALAGDERPSGGHTEPRRLAPPHRELHPEVSSGGGAFDRVAPRAASHPRTTSGHRVSWTVSPGVTYTRWRQTDARGPIVAHLLTVDPTTPGLRIDYANRGAVRRVATVRQIVSTAGGIAGVNGDFYDIGNTGAPLGLGKERDRGLIHARRDGWNNAFFINRSGRPDIDDLPMDAQVLGHPDLHVTNLNSSFVASDGIGIYTPRWGRTAGYQVTRGQREHVRQVVVQDGRVVRSRARLSDGREITGMVLIGRGDGAAALRRELPVGTRVRATWSLQGRPRMAISGNHFLIRDGIIRVVDDRILAPRTAIGIDSDTEEVLVLVVDGRSERSRGYTMVELAELMSDLGADQAINLDGGGSSTMVGPDREGAYSVLNTPSDGFERRVANAVSISYRAPSR